MVTTTATRKTSTSTNPTFESTPKMQANTPASLFLKFGDADNFHFGDADKNETGDADSFESGARASHNLLQFEVAGRETIGHQTLYPVPKQTPHLVPKRLMYQTLKQFRHNLNFISAGQNVQLQPNRSGIATAIPLPLYYSCSYSFSCSFSSFSIASSPPRATTDTVSPSLISPAMRARANVVSRPRCR